MDHEKLRKEVIRELERIQAYAYLAESWSEWDTVGRKLCDLDTVIDTQLRPDLYDVEHR
jgi:hypothetical protein